MKDFDPRTEMRGESRTGGAVASSVPSRAKRWNSLEKSFIISHHFLEGANRMQAEMQIERAANQSGKRFFEAPPKWIISARGDLFWFIGSALFGYAVLLLYGVGHVPLAIIIPIWAIIFDETHNFATISRTYFDKEELQRRRKLLWGSVVVFILAGPLIIIAGMGDWLEIITSVWAYQHLVKQHYGFMVMYKKKNDDLNRIDNLIDRAFFYIVCWYPFLTLPFHDSQARELVFSAFSDHPEQVMLSPFVNSALMIYQRAFFALLIIAVVVYLARQIIKARRRLPLNLPKQLLFLAVIPLHYIALRYAEISAAANRFLSSADINFRVEATPLAVIGIVAALTIYHNVQYHGIVWLYSKNRYKGADARARFGLSARINTRIQYYAAFALLYAFMLDVVPRFILPYFAARQSPGWNNTGVNDQIIAYLFAWPGLLHYWLDSKIWKVRRDKTVNQTLNLNTAN
jgi:hypothetical protein